MLFEITLEFSFSLKGILIYFVYLNKFELMGNDSNHAQS
jgi:hypothetical protein